MLGTSGNLSAVVQQAPLLLAMSPSGADKGELTAEQILLVDEYARVINSDRKPSDETLLHLEIVKERQPVRCCILIRFGIRSCLIYLLRKAESPLKGMRC